MSEFYSLISKIQRQNTRLFRLIPISLNVSAVLNRGVIKIIKTTAIILCLIIIGSVKCEHG